MCDNLSHRARRPCPNPGGNGRPAGMSYSQTCPNGTETGCMCVQHHPGLTAHNPNLAPVLASIANRATLRVVTMPTQTEPHDPASCDRMVCDDPACITANAKRQAHRVRQPWEARPAA